MVSYTVSSADQIVDKFKLEHNIELQRCCKAYEMDRDILGKFIEGLVLNDVHCSNLSAEIG